VPAYAPPAPVKLAAQLLPISPGFHPPLSSHTHTHISQAGITKQTFTRASTPSDRRAAAEQLAELRRLDDGVLRAVRAGGDLQAASAQAATEALQKRIGREFDTLKELENSELVRQQRSLIAALQEEWVATCCA
jgi:hypothetical protein